MKRTAFLFGAIAVSCFGLPDTELKTLRDFAIALQKSKVSGAPGAYCESIISRQTNACCKIENKYSVHSGGTVEMRIFKSYREGPRPRPGLYKGLYPTEKWVELVNTVSIMRWDEAQGYLPMPSPNETISQLVLSDGTRSARYSMASQDISMSIKDGFYFPGILAQYATDTVWALTLIHETNKIKKGILEIKAAWKLSGHSHIWLAFPISSETPSCGKTTLKWHGESADWNGGHQRINADLNAKMDTVWIKVKPNSHVRQTFRFSLPVPIAKGKRSGKLIQTGVLIKTSESEAPMSIVLHSDDFSF